jgi:hypothetical protein
MKMTQLSQTTKLPYMVNLQVAVSQAKVEASLNLHQKASSNPRDFTRGEQQIYINLK